MGKANDRFAHGSISPEQQAMLWIEHMKDGAGPHRKAMVAGASRFAGGQHHVIAGQKSERSAENVISPPLDFAKFHAGADEVTALDRHSMLDEKSPHRVGGADDL